MELPNSPEDGNITPTDYHKVEGPELTQFLINQSELFKELEKGLSSLSRNLYKLINDLGAIDGQEKIQENLTKVSEYTQEIEKLVVTLQERIPEMNDGLNQKKAQIEELSESVKSLEINLKKKNDDLEIAETKVTEQANQIQNQSAFCSAMGSTLGYMTWKSFKSVDVEIFIESATLRDFISLANNTIPSFMSAYNLNLPDFESDEFKFFMAIGGTITNISAQKSGREYMLKENVGLQLLDTIIKIIVEIPMPKGKILKRTFLMTLYNMSISKKGALHIQLSENGVQNILKCFEETNTVDIQTLAIQLLLLLLEELPTKEYRLQLASKTSRESLAKLMETEDSNLTKFAKDYSDKLEELLKQD